MIERRDGRVPSSGAGPSPEDYDTRLMDELDTTA
ncbi:hypothetical protein QFZ71_001082 [Streptomyces sp. V2I9]|nr:hypothetical protein [Streptomyces sp. V2I9]